MNRITGFVCRALGSGAVIAGALCVGSWALAQPTQAPRHGPPAESLAACKTLASGAACSFTSPRGAETGTCFAPEGKPLACRPARGSNGGGPQGKPGDTERPKATTK